MAGNTVIPPTYHPVPTSLKTTRGARLAALAPRARQLRYAQPERARFLLRRIAIAQANGQHAACTLRLRPTTTATDRAREKSRLIFLSVSKSASSRWKFHFRTVYLTGSLRFDRQSCGSRDGFLGWGNIMDLPRWLVFRWQAGHLARWRTLAAVVLTGIFSVRLFLIMHYRLIQFSGAGFSNEFFLHLETESFRVAWKQFPELIVSGVIAILVLGSLVAWLARKIPPLPACTRIPAAIAAALMLWSARGTLAEWQFVHGWWRWNHPEHSVALPPHRSAIWQESNLAETQITSKDKISVEVPEK